MSSDHTNARPVCTWVPVTDASGRTHLEARWGTLGDVRRPAAA